MMIERRYKPWLCCAAATDLSRQPELHYVFVDEPGWLFVCNGVMMVVVPVILEKDDVPGYISADVLRHAVEQSPLGEKWARLCLRPKMVQVKADGSWHRRQIYGESLVMDQNTFRHVVDAAIKNLVAGADYISWIIVNPELLATAGRALDVGYKGLELRFAGQQNPILLLPADSRKFEAEAGGWPVNSFGLLMPMCNVAAEYARLQFDDDDDDEDGSPPQGAFPSEV